MKKYLLTLLTSIVLIPSVSSAAGQATTYNKNLETKNQVNKLDADNAKALNADGSINWDNINSRVDEFLDSASASTPAGDVDEAKEQAKQYTTDFGKKNYTLDQANQYFRDNNSDFNQNFTNDDSNFTDPGARILNHFFGSERVDLGLFGSNTYQDAINSLTNKIQNEYTGVNVKMSLVDDKQKNTTLFDFDDITQFINEGTDINVNLQVNSEQTKQVTIKLTNVQLDPIKEAQQLDACIKWYFGSSNPEDLKLTAMSTRIDALKALTNEIGSRFNLTIGNNLNDNNGIQMDFVNKPEASSRLIDDGNLNYVFDQNFWFDVNIKNNYVSPDITKVSLYLANVDFDFITMVTSIHNLFLTGASKNNLQNLGLTTDSSYLEVLDKLNGNLEKIDPDNQFVVQLADPGDAARTLNDQYNPSHEEQTFFVNFTFGYMEEGKFYAIGTGPVYLGNVKIGAQAEKTKEAYNAYKDMVHTFKTIHLALEIAATTASVSATALFVAAFFTENPLLAEWAWGLTVADYVLVVAAGGFATAIWADENKLTSWQSAASLGFKEITSFGRVYLGTIYTLWTSTIASLVTMTTNFIVIAILETLVGLGAALYEVYEYFFADEVSTT